MPEKSEVPTLSGRGHAYNKVKTWGRKWQFIVRTRSKSINRPRPKCVNVNFQIRTTMETCHVQRDCLRYPWFN